ncbi:MAG: hypothetical protein QOI12_4272 [Alphaproteobacteria bacterium]|nr:hypothetical protein [Alphaproteobacteria bacterium]
MRSACSDQRWPGALGVAALFSGALALAGCASSLPSLSTDWFPSLPGFSTVRSGPAANADLASAAAPVMALDDDCPTVDIRAGASTLAIAAKAQQPSANDLRYQLTFTQLARQCALIGSTIRMRVGVQGRVIVGPAGAPSQVEAPLRYAVVREGVEPKPIVTRFRRIAVILPPGAANALFTDIEEDLSFPKPPDQELAAYVVYVGFDEIGDRPQRPPPAKKTSPKAKAK